MTPTNTGLMTPKDDNTLLASLRKALGPTDSTPPTLEQVLQSLDPGSLQLVLTTAYMVKVAHRFKHNNKEPYAQLLRRMYPRLNVQIQNIIAAILNDADPIADAESSDATQRDTIRSELLNAYKSVAPSNESDETLLQSEFDPDTHSAFIKKMAFSESSGDPGAEITLTDGRTFTGLYQMGEARLDDYRQATGARFTTEQFKQDEALQHQVAAWHFDDIEQAISELGSEVHGFDKYGLKAVAHIGGIAGMKQYVRTQGEYNPSDMLGTHLSDYYSKFSRSSQ